MEEYKTKDTENTGAISLTDWIIITGQVLELKLPWRSLRYCYFWNDLGFTFSHLDCFRSRAKLVKLNDDGLVIYESAFEGIYISRMEQAVWIFSLIFLFQIEIGIIVTCPDWNKFSIMALFNLRINVQSVIYNLGIQRIRSIIS